MLWKGILIFFLNVFSLKQYSVRVFALSTTNKDGLSGLVHFFKITFHAVQNWGAEILVLQKIFKTRVREANRESPLYFSNGGR